jgi:hypothetical protein
VRKNHLQDLCLSDSLLQISALPGSLETTQLVEAITVETGLFRPSQRASDLAALDEDPELSGSKRKKKARKNNAKRMGLSEEEINGFLERL